MLTLERRSYARSVRASLHLSTRPAASTGLSQRSTGHSVVGMCVQLNRCSVLCCAVLQRGQRGEGLVIGAMLFKYCLRSGPLPARSWARVLLGCLLSGISVASISGAGAFSMGLGGRFCLCIFTMCVCITLCCCLSGALTISSV